MAGALVLTSAAWAALTPHRVNTALACTGGIGPFESFATETELIVLVEAIAVGDGVNRAPTVTASPTPSPTATLAPSVTPSPASSPQPEPPRPDPGPVDFDLQVIGTTFRVKRVIAGSTPDIIEHQWEYRAVLEAEIRRREAGAWSGIESCALGAFTVRYEAGREYLLFFNEYEGQLNAWASFPVHDGHVVLDDARHTEANFGVLYMEAATHGRYFPGVRFDEGFIRQPRVPLDMLLRAVAGLRGDPTIAPPDAGNAGLKDLTP
jgi:hypothetical protein